ncbi:MAG: bifunctional [glutamine synthetase] adenylyltransferase/[glutamine synthetase]-adenylyl-L-tyrosine phosphorylase, partial [Pseudomonadota bacterium]
PDPGATPVALSVDGALSYYEALGQNWERAAMIKARPCAGDYAVGDRFLAALRPFIWRRHLDYAAIADVHAMKRQIHAVKGFGAIAVPGHNVKLGRGGIREIEFFSQTQQLIAGGRAPQLRAPTTRGALGALTDAGWIEANARDTLYRAYRLLRAIEHRLQMRRDEQTHTLPTSDTELDAFSAFCGYTRPQTFFDDLTSCLTAVQDHYAVLFESEPALSSACGSLVFTGVDADPETLETLTRFGFGDPKDAWRTIAGWHQASIPALRTARSREILTALKPVLLDAMQQTGNTDAAFIAFNRFLRQLPAGVQLFSLLKSNPPLLQLLMTVLGTAPRLGLALSRRVALLDALLDPRFFGGIPDRSVMEDALTAAFTDCQSHEDMLDAARIVGQDQKFLVGVRQLTGNLATEVAAGAYSDLAEVLIEKLLAACLSDIERAHGQVAGGRVAVVAMGRLGSREMTAGSDLDLILIYDHNADAEASDGARPLAPSTYFARLTQRLIAALAAPTARGTLYEVDMRLRPSGRSGPVATRVDSFETYQKDQAWVWVHLALTRARPVAGDRDLMARLEVIAETVLHAERDAQKVLTATADMRARLGAEKAPTSALDLKRLPGGLNDIAFIAQALQLTHAAARPMARARNTGAALRALAEAEALSPVDGETLLDAFALFDAVNQRMAVMTDVPFDPNTAPSGAMRLLCEAAGVPDQARLLARIADARHAVDAICDRLFSSGITPDDHGAGAPWTNKETDP